MFSDQTHEQTSKSQWAWKTTYGICMLFKYTKLLFSIGFCSIIQILQFWGCAHNLTFSTFQSFQTFQAFPNFQKIQKSKSSKKQKMEKLNISLWTPPDWSPSRSSIYVHSLLTPQDCEHNPKTAISELYYEIQLKTTILYI